MSGLYTNLHCRCENLKTFGERLSSLGPSGWAVRFLAARLLASSVGVQEEAWDCQSSAQLVA